MESTNMLHVYTGNGKGKTTAAMGLALRMLGIGKEVLIVQFMKQGNSSELVSLEKLSGAHIYKGAVMRGFVYQMDEERLEQARRDQTAQIDQIIRTIHEIRPAMIILDELAVASSYYLVPPQEAMRLIDEGLRFGEVVVTGRGASEALINKADYVSVIEAKKHPYDIEGLRARKGIEW
jgi:cob(I)alamin adenosyltransferase